MFTFNFYNINLTYNYIMDLLKITVYLSLLIQILTGIFDYYVVSLNIPSHLLLLQQVLIMELLVQVVD